MVPFRFLRRVLAALVGLALLQTASSANADPADIDAASRGVVRVIIIGDDNGGAYPVSHGTGFAVTPERIVTNAHVVEEARADRDLSIAIVPSDGGKVVYGKITAFSPRNDLALLATTVPLKLPPLTISGTPDTESGPVTSVGYPMNVDRAQGLGVNDIFRAQPPVKSRGFLSGARPTRDFDTLLHTAPIGKGSSGGPLLDNCGRVVGVNSFGAESDGTDSEFYFAVSTRELLPFLRDSGITAQVNGLPCRSLAELDAAERARAEREKLVAIQQQQERAARVAARSEEVQREQEFAIIEERENAMMLTFLLLVCGVAGGFIAWREREEGKIGPMKIAAGAAAVALAVALFTWLSRPSFGDVEDRVAAILDKEAKAETGKQGAVAIPAGGAARLVCVVNVDRSRITSIATDDIPFTWTEQGCVNGRTQYGLRDGKWSRILVPNDEAAVSVNSFDPATREYRVERYLLAHDAMEAVRKARSEFDAPQCGASQTDIAALGNNQSAITALLPAQPNERVIYDCHPAQ
ncbi:serine protease [Altererythrobacter fulvus]|uniref:S1 family peptidase n=1 Tax=Caenibius fulvus TaxID=2126012 RepID=UPI00301AF375